MKNFVMGAKIDPKVLMDLFVFKICGWNISQPSNRKLWEGIEENDPQLLSVKIPSGYLFLTIQYLERQLLCDDPNVKESKWQSRLLTLLCAVLCESLVTLQQQHFAASNDST